MGRLLPLLVGYSFLLNLSGCEELASTINFGEGESLTFSMRGSNKDAYEPSFDTLATHDCNTIREVNENDVKLEPEWLEKNKDFKWMKRLDNEFVKYNHAYGIVIFGIANFTDDSMRRACYLVRYLFADNEHFRRHAFLNGGVVQGERGGFARPSGANVGNAALSCNCSWDLNLYVIPPAHELSHWYIRVVLPEMVKAGDLVLPTFQGTDLWTKTTPNNEWCQGDKVAEKLYDRYGEMYSYLWNERMQITAYSEGKPSQINCGYPNLQHSMDYGATGKFHSLQFGGEGKQAKRDLVKEERPNLYNLLKLLWPCNNKYIGVCEDSVRGMTLGLAQRFKIGKSIDPANPNKMECVYEKEAEIEEAKVTPLPELPTEDVYYGDNKIASQDKCQKQAVNTNLLTTDKQKWTTDDTGERQELRLGKLFQPLVDSHEYAWYLRKCCAKSARTALLPESDEEKAKREEKEAKQREYEKCYMNDNWDWENCKEKVSEDKCSKAKVKANCACACAYWVK